MAVTGCWSFMITYIIMSSCHIISLENKILRPQTYHIQVMAMQRGQDTCEGVCEDPSTQASKHCTANPFSVSKIVIAQSFYDVASLKLQKNTLFYHNDCELVTCAVVCSIRWCSGQLKRTEKYCRFFGCSQIPYFNKQTNKIREWLFWRAWRKYNGRPALNAFIRNHTLYLSFLLHGQNFWRIKFTRKNANFSL